ncbi:MAG: bifunctional folylpolyglutamate synthase/dihydrofolate synthase [Desulfuromonas sp.]|nr:MAG: bifunctional folylpolyglutamate synthase/dihydrofolate synthase [Desulfuromonas sp.]
METRHGLDFLYGLQRFGIKLGLEKVRCMLQALENPDDGLRFLHLAGTNGKGSTAFILSRLLSAAGQRTGLYTSPHLHRFNERIQVDGNPIADGDLDRLIERVKPLCLTHQATFFEAATLIALLYFSECACDWVVLETGLGGRFDATNVVCPHLCLMTPVAMDHAEYLGETLADIAGEKAGIFKPGVKVLSAPQEAVVTNLFHRKASELGISMFESGQDWTCDPEGKGFRFEGFGRIHVQENFRLLGSHQIVNAGLALAAFADLCNTGECVWPSDLNDTLRDMIWPGRLEWIKAPRPVLLDGAHNMAGVETLRCYLEAEGIRGVELLFGCKQDKQWREMLELLLPFCERVFLVQPPIEGGVPPDDMAGWVSRQGVDVTVAKGVEDAVPFLVQGTRKHKALVVAGSLFLVAAVREKILGPVVSGKSCDRLIRAM